MFPLSLGCSDFRHQVVSEREKLSPGRWGAERSFLKLTDGKESTIDDRVLQNHQVDGVAMTEFLWGCSRVSGGVASGEEPEADRGQGGTSKKWLTGCIIHATRRLMKQKAGVVS